MQNYEVKPIGTIKQNKETMEISLAESYIPGLKALDGFSHLTVIWWFSDFDTPEARSVIDTAQPYRSAPETMGIFATRSPVRPNPLALSTVQVISIDYESGVIQIPYIDANDGSPVLDIKPYTPSIDRVESPLVPEWCTHWPMSYETSGEFDWEKEFIY